MRDVETVLKRVKGAAPNAGQEILLPGERENRAWQARRRNPFTVHR